MVSVCVLSYNHERYLRQCLDGIFMQEVSFPIEVRVHDDASTDRSQEIIKEYQERYPDILKPLLQSENQYSKGGGILNKFLLPLCEGKYIALCEGDDYWTDPLKLQKQVDFLEKHEDYGFVGSNVFVESNGKRQAEPSKLFGVSEGDFELVGDVFESAKYGPVTRTVSLVYRRDLVRPYNKYSGGDLLLQSILAKLSKYAYYRGYSCVYRAGVGISNSFLQEERALKYNEIIIKQRKTQKMLFPKDCNWPEDELEDHGDYLRLIYAIRKVKWKKALICKKTLRSVTYRNKSYSKYLFGPISCFFLSIVLKMKHHE